MIRTLFNAAKAITLPGSETIPLDHETLGVGDWESLTHDDAGVGEFVTLPNGAQMHYVTRGPINNAPRAQCAAHSRHHGLGVQLEEKYGRARAASSRLGN